MAMRRRYQRSFADGKARGRGERRGAAAAGQGGPGSLRARWTVPPCQSIQYKHP